MIRLLLGLQKTLQGTIEVFDETPERRQGEDRLFTAEACHLSEMTIEALKLVRLGPSGRRWGLGFYTILTARALKVVGAEELAHRSLGVLSGGELQRAFLAEALVSEPELLSLDEPLSNLDIRGEQELVQLISSGSAGRLTRPGRFYDHHKSKSRPGSDMVDWMIRS